MIKSKGDFVFNGHGLTPSKIYELINYVDDWPGVGSASFGTGTVDADGNVHIKGDAGEMTGVSGKIWLVLKDDFDTDRMVDWNPTAYLFEYDMI